MIAYLKTIDNASDEIAIRRVINIPKRGIGAASLLKVSTFAQANGLTFYEALRHADNIPGLGRAAAKIDEFTAFIEEMKSMAQGGAVPRILKTVIDRTAYVEELRLENTDEAKARIENIDELISKAVTYQEGTEEASLSGFLEEVALIADIDDLDEAQDYVVLMTLHSAKGLEFPYVYLAGMEDGLFPGYMSIMADNSEEELEEERRLAYVGITRAKVHLTLTAARARMIRGETQYNSVSRFVKEIPSALLDGEIYQPKSRDDFGMSVKDDLTTRSAPGVKRRQAYVGQTSQSKKVAVKSTYSSQSMGTRIAKNPLSYGEGDQVRHAKFGVGRVTQIRDGGRDYEVTVEFESGNTKKMFASFAKLEKI